LDFLHGKEAFPVSTRPSFEECASGTVRTELSDALIGLLGCTGLSAEKLDERTTHAVAVANHALANLRQRRDGL
jgi:hypothetical protein